MIVYIIEYLRNGDRKMPSYIGGILSDRKIAEYTAQSHMNMRAGKYSAQIYEMIVDTVSSRRLISIIDEALDDDELEIAIKSRQDYLKYRNKIRGS